MPISRENFVLGHTVRSNKFPKGVQLDQIEKAHPDAKFDLSTLGLWETGQPNFNTYYPDVTAEDLKPSDNEFVYPIVRALSKTRVNKYGPINFGANDALKRATKKLIGQTIYTNHDTSIGNELGVIMEASWEESFTQKGVTIPAGINVRLKVDGKSNPKIARGMMMEPPAIHSFSVSVEYQWEQSHPALSSDEFWSKLGTFDEKGNLIERVVTEIVSFHEISAVSHGADPYAQIKNDKGIALPEYAKRAQKYDLTADLVAEKGNFFDWTTFEADDHAFTEKTIPNELNNQQTQNQNNSSMNEQQLIFFREKLGLAKVAPASDVYAKLQELMPGWLQLKTDLDANKQTLSALQTKYPEGSEVLSATQKAELAQYQTVLKATREEALKFYNLSTDKPSESIQKLIAEGSYETVAALRDQYKKTAEDQHELTCNDCQSKNVSRASAKKEESNAGKGGNGNSTTKAKSTAEVASSLSATIGKPTNGIHGED